MHAPWTGQRLQLVEHPWCGELVKYCTPISVELRSGLGFHLLHGPKFPRTNDTNLDGLAGSLQLGQFRGEIRHLGFACASTVSESRK